MLLLFYAAAFAAIVCFAALLTPLSPCCFLRLIDISSHFDAAAALRLRSVTQAADAFRFRDCHAIIA